MVKAWVRVRVVGSLLEEQVRLEMEILSMVLEVEVMIGLVVLLVGLVELVQLMQLVQLGVSHVLLLLHLFFTNQLHEVRQAE